MAQAANLSGEFSPRLGWTASKRDEKLEALVDVIVKYAEIKVSCAVENKSFAKYLRTLAVPKRTLNMNKPYAIAFQNIILATASVFSMYGVNRACDFIFDEQGKIGEDAVAMWDNMKAIAASHAAAGRSNLPPHMGQRPIFRSDKCFLPLQAADLYAWHVRREFIDDRVPPRNVMRRLSAISTISRYVDARELINLRKNLDGGATKFAASNPGVPFFAYQGTRAEQKRRRADARSKKTSEKRTSRRQPS